MQAQTDSEKANEKDKEHEQGQDCRLEKEEARRRFHNSRPHGGHEGHESVVPKDCPGKKEKARTLLITHQNRRNTGSQEEINSGGGGEEK